MRRKFWVEYVIGDTLRKESEEEWGANRQPFGEAKHERLRPNVYTDSEGP